LTIATKLLATAAAVALLGTAGAANAAITAVSTVQNYGADVTANPVVTCTFDAPCIGPVTITPAGGSLVQSGSNSNGAAPPGDATAYMSIVGGGSATLSAVGNFITGLSFFMGSPDAYNSVSFFSGATLLDTLTGNQFNGAPADGNQSVGQRVSFTGLPGNVTSVVFNSSSTAFEFDRVIATIAPVPEPATWAMMILGMGMVGAGLRLRRRQTQAVAA
jgi:hypothetical protein